MDFWYLRASSNIGGLKSTPMTLPLAPTICANNVASLAAARTEIENGLAGTNVTRRIAAAVVLFDDFVRDDFE